MNTTNNNFINTQIPSEAFSTQKNPKGNQMIFDYNSKKSNKKPTAVAAKEISFKLTGNIKLNRLINTNKKDYKNYVIKNLYADKQKQQSKEKEIFERY